MVNYECKICNYLTIRKNQYHRHLNTKKHIEKEKTINELKKKNMKKMSSECHPNVNPSLICPNCGKVFSSRQSKSRHIKKRCQVTKTKEVENETINIKEHTKIITNLLSQYMENTEKMLEKNQEYTKELLKKNNQTVYNQQIKDSFNNTNYVLNFYNYIYADSMNDIVSKFKLNRDEYVKAALTSSYHNALLEKADNVIIRPYLTESKKRPIHTVDPGRKKALYKDNAHQEWTYNPDKTLQDCFDLFHKSALEERDKIILENSEYIPVSDEDSLYKQIYFIPTEKKEKETVHKKVGNYIYQETRIKKEELIKNSQNKINEIKMDS